MAKMDFGGVTEDVVTRDEFPLTLALEKLKSEVVAIVGYGPQGHGQSLNLRDNGVNVIVGQRKGGKGWDDAIGDGWVEGKNLFSNVEEVVERATVIQYLLSDAGQKEMWPVVSKHLKKGKALYFSHGFSIVFKEQTGVVPPKDVDVILVAPKGSGRSLTDELSRRQRDQLKLCNFPGRNRSGEGTGSGVGDRDRVGISLCDNVRERSAQRFDGRTRRPDGSHRRSDESAVRHACVQWVIHPVKHSMKR